VEREPFVIATTERGRIGLPVVSLEDHVDGVRGR
jgi:hypothetical protein